MSDQDQQKSTKRQYLDKLEYLALGKSDEHHDPDSHEQTAEHKIAFRLWTVTSDMTRMMTGLKRDLENVRDRVERALEYVDVGGIPHRNAFEGDHRALTDVGELRQMEKQVSHLVGLYKDLTGEDLREMALERAREDA